MNNHPENTTDESSIRKLLSQIVLFMEKELEFKNAGIKKQSEVIDSLLQQREELKKQLITAQEDLGTVRQLANGKKQLVDKLLGDVARLQQDVEWYKRTYEERSFWGTISEKIFRRFKIYGRQK